MTTFESAWKGIGAGFYADSFSHISFMDYRKVRAQSVMTYPSDEGASDNRTGRTAYLPPRIEVVTAVVELGFAASNDGGGMQLPGWDII